MSEEISFTQTECIICSTANAIEGDKSYWVAIGGTPMVAVLLARKQRCPNVLYMIEEGYISPTTPHYNFAFTGAGSDPTYRSVCWTGINTLTTHCGGGYYDYGILDSLQIDQHGNLNTTMLGDSWEHPKRRFGGAGGATEIASLCWRTIVLTEISKQKFPAKVDFISSPGFLDGSPHAREKVGLPPNTGPWRVFTDKANFGFDEKTHRMKLLSVAPWSSVDEVRSLLGFEPVIAEHLEPFEVPTEEQLTLLRTELEPSGTVIHKGDWITYKPK
jgi:glutaconate CoA-transferase subunit B